MNVDVGLMKRVEADYAPVLTAVFELMLGGGMRKDDLRALCALSLQRAVRKSPRGRKTALEGLPVAALVLDAWHRDHRYLNAKAEPRAVRLLGPAPSVEALIRTETRRGNAQDLAYRLESLRLVVSAGKGLYRPTSDIALISAHDPFVLQHVAKSLLMLLETVSQNLECKASSEPLIERFAEVPDLPREWVPAFQRFTKIHGWVLLRTVNDWLESRRARRTNRVRKESARVGIHVHAYVTRRTRSRASRRSTPTSV
jgi:hypothetical protein